MINVMKDTHCHHCHPSHEGEKHPHKPKIDYLLWGSGIIIMAFFLLHVFFKEQIKEIAYIGAFADATVELLQMMWWGMAMGVISVGLLGKIPREFVMAVLGKGGTVGGVVRAVIAGVFLDLCSHGILLVGTKLYERGASLGQMVAFLVASPWNSLSLTFVLISLVGLPWTLAFLGLSMVIGIITGVVYDRLVARGILPKNPNEVALTVEVNLWKEAKQSFKETSFNARWLGLIIKEGIVESQMVLRWLLFGMVLAALVRTLVPTEDLQTYFGATLAGLGLTLVVATLLEVCSEGAVPIAADLLTRAGAPGNSFAFLMTGVATDYTEIMAIKETTGSWKISLFLPLITVPQVVLMAWMMNIIAL